MATSIRCRTRIAHIRTWTFAANRPDWLADPEHWQGVARGVEDRLSDALHERLAERFVDRRTSVLMRRLRENTMLETEISKTGEVVVEGHSIGRLEGFRSRRCLRRRTRKRRRCAAPRRRRWPARSRRAPPGLSHAPDDAIRARLRRHDPLARRAGRQARRPATKCCGRACASSPTSI